MRVPYEWLKEFLGDALPPLERTVDLLDGLGLAVETVHSLPGAPRGVVVVDILEAEAIAGSDHLLRTVVTDGVRSTEVVCGAANAVAGARTALARPGAELPGAHHEQGDAGRHQGADPVVVTERTIHGVLSHGMLASPRELGLFEHGAGIITFARDTPLGADLAELWPAEEVIELELTPNRGDAFSMLGVARDLAAKLGAPLRDPTHGADLGDPSSDDGLTLEVADAGACPRLTLRGLAGVQVGPSPVWLQRRLAALGLRPRNNVVDVTNYVTFELGQPSHAYDRRALTNGVLQVRRAVEGEQVTLLNEEQITLHDEDLVIATPDGAGGSRAIGLAGVMGGLHDSVAADTDAIAIEVAHFDPRVVRRSARRHKLVTDAHVRFERGVDPNLPRRASARVASLVQAVAGGLVAAGTSETGADVAALSVRFRPSRVAFLTDMQVPEPEQRSYLEGLGCAVAELGEDAWEVTVPSWRFDLGIEEDLIEEVARMHGYEHIGDTVPAMHFVPPAHDPTHRALRAMLAALGHQETMNYVFTGDAELARAEAPAASVRLSEPQGIERAVLRTSLVPGLLATAAENHAATSLALFEVGRVFGETEQERVGLLWRGPWIDGRWRPGQAIDFFIVKGVLEALASLHGVELRCDAAELPGLHPGVGARVWWDGGEVGTLGRLHPEVAARYGLSETYVAELAIPLATHRIRFEEIQRQPFAERDLAVLAPEAVTFAQLRSLVAGAAGGLLASLEPFDVYQGRQVTAGRRSIALRFRFRHPERALTDVEVDGYMRNVMSAVRDAGYDIRT